MILENVKFAFGSLWANKARAVLTMLGVIIGVFSVITLVSIGEGIRGEFSSQIESIGSNIIEVASGNIDIGQESSLKDENIIYTQPEESGGFSSLMGSMSETLTYQDRIDIEEQVEGLKYISGMSMVPFPPFYGEKMVIGPMVLAIEPAGFELFKGSDVELEAGEYFKEDINQRQVAIGLITKDGIFGEDTPYEEVIGQNIIFEGEEFEIIAIFKEKEDSSTAMLGQSFFGDSIIMPLSTSLELTGADKFFRIILDIEDAEKVTDAKAQIESILLENHNQAEDFSVFTEEDMLNLFDEFLGILTQAVAGIAAISLIVGGIGIMNIMLVSVTERTREIGVRKSIGATSFNILIQFLIEAIVLGILGGAIGVLLAYLAGFVIETYANIPTIITYDVLIVAFGISFIVGVVFGMAPAVKASRKSPIEALRYE